MSVLTGRSCSREVSLKARARSTAHWALRRVLMHKKELFRGGSLKARAHSAAH